jgi:hypothetical protein
MNLDQPLKEKYHMEKESKQEAKKETLTNNRSDQAGILDQARLRPHFNGPVPSGAIFFF